MNRMAIRRCRALLETKIGALLTPKFQTMRVYREIQNDYSAQKGVMPNAQQMEQLVDRWLYSELLYRQGLELGLDKSDLAIRERVIQKTEQLYQSIAAIDAPKEADLQNWYQSKAHNYRLPATYSFEHIPFAKSDTEAKQKAQSALALVQQDTWPNNIAKQVQAFNSRNEVNLRIAFGREFTQHISQLPLEKWRLLESKKYWHVLKLTQYSKARLPAFEDVAQQVRSDWRRQQQQRAVVKLVDELKQRYQIIRSASEI